MRIFLQIFLLLLLGPSRFRVDVLEAVQRGNDQSESLRGSYGPPSFQLVFRGFSLLLTGYRRPIKISARLFRSPRLQGHAGNLAAVLRRFFLCRRSAMLTPLISPRCC